MRRCVAREIRNATPRAHTLLEVRARKVLCNSRLELFLLVSLLWFLPCRAPEHSEICSDVLEAPTAYALPDRIRTHAMHLHRPANPNGSFPPRRMTAMTSSTRMPGSNSRAPRYNDVILIHAVQRYFAKTFPTHHSACPWRESNHQSCVDRTLSCLRRELVTRV